MGKKCLIPNCTSGYKGKVTPEAVSLHIFPVDPGIREEWIKVIPRKD